MKKSASVNQFQDHNFQDIIENTPEIMDAVTNAIRDQQETALELTRLALKYSSVHCAPDKAAKQTLNPDQILEIFKKSAVLIKSEFSFSNI